MPLRRPFVYVASLRRTGSTMLANLLSDPPKAYVFREPRFGLAEIRTPRENAKFFAPHGLDLIGTKRSLRKMERGAALARIAEFVEQCSAHFEQIGIKEITHTGWEDVSRLFPEMRVVVTVRDPRDIYLSLYHRRKELLQRGKLWFETQTLLPYLREQTDAIFGLMARHSHLVARYEDVCADESWIARIREFVASPVTGTGMLRAGADRGDLAKHGTTIDSTRVGLFRRETDEIARHNAMYLFEELADFAERFGYTP
jgi:Sulfotransferase family